MSRKNRIALRTQRREERGNSYKGIISKKYKEMAKKGLLGRMELDKYELMRREIINHYEREGGCPYFPCESRGETPTRNNYDLLTQYYNRLP